MANKISIDPRALVAWTTSTNYRVAVTAGLVIEIGNNQTPSPAISSQVNFTSFSNGPYVTSTNYMALTSSTFLSNAVLTYNRTLRSISSTATYQVVSSTAGVIKTLSAGDVSFDGNRSVTLPFGELTIPDGDYYITSDAGIWTDDFNFPNVQETVLGFVGGISPIFHISSMSNLDVQRNYIAGQGNLIFAINPPQIIDNDSSISTQYTVTFAFQSGGSLNGDQTWTYTNTKAIVNAAIRDLEFIYSLSGDPDVNYTVTLSKKGVTLLGPKTLTVYGTPFTLGGTLTLATTPTSPTYRHWYKHIPLVATLNTSTRIRTSDSGTNPMTFRTISKNGVSSATNITTTGPIVNNSSTVDVQLSTGTYVVEAYWPGRGQSPKYYAKTGTQITVVAAERNDYPGQLTLTAPASIYELSLNKFHLTASINTSTTGTITFYSADTQVTTTNFTGSTSTDIYAYTLGNTFNAYWEGQPENGSNVPYYGTYSNTVTQAVITGTLTLSAPTTQGLLSDCGVIVTANTSSVIDNTVNLYNGPALVATTTIPANTSSVAITIPAGVLPLTTVTTIITTTTTGGQTITTNILAQLTSNTVRLYVALSDLPAVGATFRTTGGQTKTLTAKITDAGLGAPNVRMTYSPSGNITGAVILTTTGVTTTTTYSYVTNYTYLNAVLTTTNATVYSNVATINVVPPSAPNIALTLTPSTYQYGAENTATSFVTVTGTFSAPSGIVTLLDTVNGELTTATLVPANTIQSTATFIWSLSAYNENTGTYILYATYPGDTNTLSTSSNNATLTVNGPFASASAISLNTSSFKAYNINGSTNTSLVTATVIISSTIGHAPSGIVSLSDGVMTIGTGTLTAINTSQSRTLISWNPGADNESDYTYTITSTYQTGDYWNQPSSTSTSLTVTKAIPSISLAFRNSVGGTTSGFTYPAVVNFTVTQPSGYNLTAPIDIVDMYDNTILATVNFNGALTTTTSIVTDTLYNTAPIKAISQEDIKFYSTSSNTITFTVAPVTNTITLSQNLNNGSTDPAYNGAIVPDGTLVVITATSVASTLISDIMTLSINDSPYTSITVHPSGTQSFLSNVLAKGIMNTITVSDPGDRNHNPISKSVQVASINKVNTAAVVEMYVRANGMTGAWVSTGGPGMFKSSYWGSIQFQVIISPVARTDSAGPSTVNGYSPHYPIGYSGSSQVQRTFNLYNRKWYGYDDINHRGGYPRDSNYYDQFIQLPSLASPPANLLFGGYGPTKAWLLPTPTGTITLTDLRSNTVISTKTIDFSAGITDTTFSGGGYTYADQGLIKVTNTTFEVELSSYVGLGQSFFKVDYSGDYFYNASSTIYMNWGNSDFIGAPPGTSSKMFFESVSYDPTDPNDPGARL